MGISRLFVNIKVKKNLMLSKILIEIVKDELMNTIQDRCLISFVR